MIMWSSLQDYIEFRYDYARFQGLGICSPNDGESNGEEHRKWNGNRDYIVDYRG